ncbi:hypothetical protein [Falsirhodobacter deserti]|uniref:hypothetical protein n=1 Tax=Falsirhodobacter deserti TaxID=1365611 RepID=UPI0019D454A5|nr:hypothetical protein [Falsirhodobacter deserti]
MNQKNSPGRTMARDDATTTEEGLKSRGPKRNWLKPALLFMLGAASAGAVSYAVTQYDRFANILSQPAAAETSNAQDASEGSIFSQHSKEAGIGTCSTVFPALGEILTSGSQYSIQSSWNAERPNDHAVQAFVGMDLKTDSYSGPAAGIVYAAPTSSACEGTMIRVVPFSTSCTEIPALLPDGSKLVNNLGQISVYYLGKNGGDALLLPSGNSCTVISYASTRNSVD